MITMLDSLFLFCSKAWVLPLVMDLLAGMLVLTACGLLAVTPDNADRAARIPRMRMPGILLGIIVLIWCIPNAMPILPESLHPYLLPTAIVLLVASGIWLDHLFARAIGGFLILCAHWFLKESYALPELTGPAFAVFTLIFGICGILLCGFPYRLRDMIRKQTDRKRKWILPAYCLFYAVILIAKSVIAWRLV